MTQLLQQGLENESLADPITGGLIVSLLQQSIQQNEQLLAKYDALAEKVANHVTKEDVLVQGFARAFPKKPDGSPDFEGHEVYHTAIIDELRERTKFFRGLRYQLIEKGFYGLLAVIVALATYWWSGQVRPPGH